MLASRSYLGKRVGGGAGMRRGSHSDATATGADAEAGEANGSSRGGAAAQAEKRDSRGSRGGEGHGRSGHGDRRTR